MLELGLVLRRGHHGERAGLTWRDRFVVREAVIGGEGGSEVTVIWFGVMETLMALRVVHRFVPLAAGQIPALCWRRGTS